MNETVALRGTIAQRNHLLNAMSNGDLALLQPYLVRVPLKFRQRLQSANQQIRSVYFLESGIASMVADDRTRRQTEVAIVGREGMTGLPVIHGAERSPFEVYVQVRGEAQCISVQDLRRVMDESPMLQKCLLSYAHVFGVQVGYTAFANAQGTIEERLARWLLMVQDRLETDVLFLTHELMAIMLGVRRAGVTMALHHFLSKGVIETARGAITVKDRDGLKECANGFYGTPEAEFERLFACQIS
jgi:CRP-like cAMP-binding protein